jgi:hypothetical protein
MVGGKAHLTWHTTETTGWAGARYYHIVFKEVSPGVVECRQYRPFTRAAKSLRNKSGGVQTNRQGTVHIQASIVGRAANAQNFSPAMYAAMHQFAVWCNTEHGIPLTTNTPAELGNRCYGSASPCRFTFAQWRAYAGHSAHAHAPENTHWDAPFDYSKILTGGGIVLPPTQQEGSDMFCKRGDGPDGAAGDRVEYWQRRILRIDPNALPRYGVDRDYGGEGAAAVASLVPGSDGQQIGPFEAEALDALIAGGGSECDCDLAYYARLTDLDGLAESSWVADGFLPKGANVTLEETG